MAFSKARKRGYKIELIFAGEGEDREKLKQLAENLGVAEFVLFTGFMAREEFFPLVDVCVSPSYHEGFPLVLLEAMYAKKSIIATKVGGVSEMLNHDCALLIDAGDVDHLLESIALLYHSKQKRTEMTELAYSRYSTHFSPEVFTQKVLELFNDR
jgi:glycosyltransferase involved in cell wall biosynthesis